MGKISKSVVLVTFVMASCLLMSCSTYRNFINFRVKSAKDNPTVQVDVVGVTAQEYKDLKDISFNAYWSRAFADPDFPPYKATFYFDQDRPKELKAKISDKILNKWASKGSEYLMIFAYLPIIQKSDKTDAYQKDGAWKKVVPLSHTDWLWLTDKHIYVDIYNDRIVVDYPYFRSL